MRGFQIFLSTPLLPFLGGEEKSLGDTPNPGSILLHRYSEG